MAAERKFESGDWNCGGWAAQEDGALSEGAAMSFREKLLWLQEADRLAAHLETQRPWIDDDGWVRPAIRPKAEDSARG